MSSASTVWQEEHTYPLLDKWGVEYLRNDGTHTPDDRFRILHPDGGVTTATTGLTHSMLAWSPFEILYTDAYGVEGRVLTVVADFGVQITNIHLHGVLNLSRESNGSVLMKCVLTQRIFEHFPPHQGDRVMDNFMPMFEATVLQMLKSKTYYFYHHKSEKALAFQTTTLRAIALAFSGGSSDAN